MMDSEPPKFGQAGLSDLLRRAQELEREYGVLLVKLSIRQVLSALVLLEQHALEPSLVAALSREVREVLAGMERYRADIERAHESGRRSAR